MDPLKLQKFRILVRGMFPAPFVYIVTAVAYLVITDGEPFFETAFATAVAVVVGAATPIWAFVVYRTAVTRQQLDVRVAQTLLVLAHVPGIAGFVLSVGSRDVWYAAALGVEALVVLVFVRKGLG